MFALGGLGSCVASTAAACACSCCTNVTQQALRSSARAAWSILFTFSVIMAWVARDFGGDLLKKLPWIVRHFSGGDLPSDAWFGQQAVYRISMGNFVLFATLAIVMLDVRYKSDRRDTGLHHGHWLVKAGLWALCNTLPFLLPVGLVGAYSWLARFGSPFFLLIQMVILLDMTQNWNDAWVEAGEEDPRFFHALLAVTVAAFAGCITIAGLLYHFFVPSSGGDCSLNISLITLSLILCLALCFVTMHPSVQRGSLFPAACISLYTMYLAYSALQSEPRDYECNALGQRLNAASATTLATGVLLTLCSTVYSAFRAGSNTRTFSAGGFEEPLIARHSRAEAEEGTSAGLDGVAPGSATMERSGGAAAAPAADEPVTYNYTQFYLVFALASMYIAMLMTGWGSQAGEAKYLINVGWTSVWVKVGSQWVTVGLYCWSLLAPLLFPDRDFS